MCWYERVFSCSWLHFNRLTPSCIKCPSFYPQLFPYQDFFKTPLMCIFKLLVHFQKRNYIWIIWENTVQYFIMINSAIVTCLIRAVCSWDPLGLSLRIFISREKSFQTIQLCVSGWEIISDIKHSRAPE